MVLALILLRPAARPTLFDERRPARTMGGDPQPLERPGHLIDEQAQAPSEPARLGDPPQEVARRRPAPRAVEGPSSPSFVPLGLEVDRDLGAFQVARIPVSRGVLAGLGLLPDDQRAGEPVMADVVFGEDGMARAIRIASMSRRTP